MDQDALKVVNRLNRHGYRSYLVGGCIRDMLLGKRPKDFDVVTTATPGQIRKVFSNSRAIGRRFKIVHIIFRGKVIEVSTFRSLPDHRLEKSKVKDEDLMMKRDNSYGSPQEDAARRDFSINALFFDPRNESLIDYVGGFEDIQEKKLSVIGDPDISFREDPVRMFRAAKFAALLDLKLNQTDLRALRRNRHEMLKANTSRMYDEYQKIFRTGSTAVIFKSFYETSLFKTMFPEAHDASMARGRDDDFLATSIGRRLDIADNMLKEREDLTPSIYFALIFADIVREAFEEGGRKNLIDYVTAGLEPAFKRLQLPGKDRERLIQIYSAQNRFLRTEGKNRYNPEHFRTKVFFYESFMVFKINAISLKNDENIQKAMFWEFGPRMRPPEAGKVISLFGGNRPRRGGNNRDRDRDRDRARKR